jgi:hypothetical protein
MQFPWVATLPAAQQSIVKQIFPLMEVLTRDSDELVAGNLMIRILESHLAARAKPTPKDGLAIARLRGRLAREELKEAEGGSVSASEAAEKLGISKTAVLNRYHCGQLIGWKLAKQGAVRFPVWQFKEDNVFPGIPETLAILNKASWMDDWARVLFFLNRRSSLGKLRPLDLLRQGSLQPVKDAAHAVIE